jgi:hypothetical protein
VFGFASQEDRGQEKMFSEAGRIRSVNPSVCQYVLFILFIQSFMSHVLFATNNRHKNKKQVKFLK